MKIFKDLKRIIKYFFYLVGIVIAFFWIKYPEQNYEPWIFITGTIMTLIVKGLEEEGKKESDNEEEVIKMADEMKDNYEKSKISSDLTSIYRNKYNEARKKLEFLLPSQSSFLYFRRNIGLLILSTPIIFTFGALIFLVLKYKVL